MPRIVLYLGLGLLVVLLLLPGLVGRVAERTLDANLRWVDGERADLELATLSFERGWFASTARHRIRVHGGVPKTLLSAPRATQHATLTLDTELVHGLIPFAALPHADLSLKPGLAGAVSRLTLAPGDGTETPLPGRLKSHIGLAGNSTFHYAIDAGQRTTDTLKARWDGGDVRVHAAANARTIGLAGHLRAATIQLPTVTAEWGNAHLDLYHDRSRYVSGVGHVQADISDLRIAGGEALAGSIDSVKLDAASEAHRNDLDGHAFVLLRQLTLPEFGSLDLDARLVFAGLAASAVEALLLELDAMRRSSPSARAQTSLTELARGGGQIELQRFDLAVPSGEGSATLSLKWPELDAAAFSWPALLLRANAAATLALDAALYDELVTMLPEMRSLLAHGILQRDGDSYAMRAELSGGLLKVNGAPFTLPLSSF